MSNYENLKEENIKNRNESNKNDKLLKTQEESNKDAEEKKYKEEEQIIIGKYSEAPDYLKDNEYIKTGYLINCHSLKLVIRSLFVQMRQ